MKGTIRETFLYFADRKMIWVLGVITLLGTPIVSLFAYMIGESQGGSPELEALRQVVLEPMLHVYEVHLAILLLITVIASASIVPHMCSKGRADFYLAKPISRTRLLLYKLVSTWLVYGGAMLLAAIITYVALTFVIGSFQAGVLWMLLTYLLLLAIWLCIAFTGAVISNSTVVTIMGVFLLWLIQMLLAPHEMYKQVIEQAWLRGLVDALYYLFPKHTELGGLSVSLAVGKPVESWAPVWTSALFALAVLAVGVAVFRRENY
jgi:ABC-type transport system involved in multi-copper enzyme maturation permease subunit